MNPPFDSLASGLHAPPSVAPGNDPGAAAWIKLQDGNGRWAAGHTDAATGRSPQRRVDLLEKQTPFAMVLSCADSRVPAELVFDQGLGDLFVVRTAGHAVDDTVLGSMEYAVTVLGVDLVLVLGHENCGAVAAAAAAVAGGGMPDGHIRSIVERLSAHINAAHQAGMYDSTDLSRWHAAATADLIQQRSTVLRSAAFTHRVRVMAATYELGSGRVVPTGTRPTAASDRSGLLAEAASTSLGFDVIGQVV